MRNVLAAAATCWLTMCAAPGASADERAQAFDGSWTTVVSCPAAAGALPYSYEFVSDVKGGLLHGERGVAEAPGWLRLDGQISADGSVTLAAHGIVGSERAALGERPRGTPYSYRVAAQFSGNSGGGQRIGGRHCTVSFTHKVS